jgi:hypothetical protein
MGGNGGEWVEGVRERERGERGKRDVCHLNFSCLSFLVLFHFVFSWCSLVSFCFCC